MKSIKFHKFKVFLVVTAMTGLWVALVPGSSLAQSIGELQRQINELSGEISSSEQRIQEIRRRGNTLKNRLAILNAEAGKIIAEIKVTEKEITETRADIRQKEDELQRTRELIQENVRVLYKQGNPSTLEILFASDSFTDFINRQEYLDRVKQSLNDAAREAVRIRDELEEKELMLAQKAEELEIQRSNLALKQQEQKRLITETRGQENRYQQLVAKQKAELEQLKQEQAMAIARAQAGGDLRFGNTDYPYIHSDCFDEDGRFNGMDEPSPCDAHVDPWRFYYQQCTSYVAWRRFDLGREIPEWGRIVPTNGKHFYDRAREDGYVVNRIPKRGAIAVDTSGKWGHVMVVEKVNSDSTINISQFNAQLDGRYSEVHDMPYSENGGGWANYWFIHDRP